MAGDGLGLASSVANRVCHDLAGLVGTLGGALELEEGALAQETAGVLAARLRLVRAAWGGGAGPLEAAEIAALARGAAGIERVRLEITGGFAELPARLVLCLLLAVGPGLARGSVLRVATRGDGVALLLDGAAAWPAGLTAGNADGTVAVRMAVLVAQDAGWRLRVEGGLMLAEPAGV